jgi:sugar phosphate isomerase/epimerase
MNSMKFGITLYCFTGEYIAGAMSLRDCFRAASRLGVEDLEIVGSQMLRSYPFVTEEALSEIKDYCSEFGTRIVSYGANMDRGKRRARDMTDEEMIASTVTDLKTAYALGARLMRVQYMIPPRVMAALAPYAEEYGVKIGVEIHNPETPSTPAMLEYFETYEKVGSEYLGFVPDFGAFATKPNKGSMAMALSMGASKEALDFAVKCRYESVPREKALEGMRRLDANEAAMQAFEDMYSFLAFYREPDLEGLKRILPYVIYCHGKFHDIGEDLVEASIPYPSIISALKDWGYDGYIMSEYEGHAPGQVVTQVERHLRLERSLAK